MEEHKVSTDELESYMKCMRRSGHLPKSVRGVAEDEYAMTQVAQTPPGRLKGELIASTTANRAFRKINRKESEGSLYATLLSELAGEVKHGSTRHEDGTPYTADEFHNQLRSSGVAEGLGRRIEEHAVSSGAESHLLEAEFRALPPALYDENKAVRILNARNVLGRRAARITNALSSVTGAVLGAITPDIAISNKSTAIAAILTGAGTLAGSSMARLFRDKIVGRSAHNRAIKLSTVRA